MTVLSGVAALFAASADLRLSHRMGYYSDIELNLQILSCTQAPLSGIKDSYTLWHKAHTGRHTSSIYLQKHTHTHVHSRNIHVKLRLPPWSWEQGVWLSVFTEELTVVVLTGSLPLLLV